MSLGVVLSYTLLAQQSNLQVFTPSALFSAGEYEVNVFNSLYTQNQARGSDGEAFDLGSSQAFFNNQIQYTRGSRLFPKLNWGIEVNISTARYGAQDENGVFNFLRSESFSSTTFKNTVIASIGPRVKFNVSPSIPRLSIQSTFLFPTSSKLEDPSFINHDRYTWFTQVFFDQDLGQKFQVFLETDFLYRINRNSFNERNFFRTPLSGFLSYFPSSNTTIFVFAQYSPRFETVENETDKQFGLSQWFTQLGGGVKFQLSSKLGLEFSASDFIAGRGGPRPADLAGAGYVVNFGLRYIYR